MIMDSKAESIKADIATLERMIIENDDAKKELERDLAFSYKESNNTRELKEFFNIKMRFFKARGHAVLVQINYWTEELRAIEHIKRMHSKVNTDNLLTGCSLKLVNVKITDLLKSTKHTKREELVHRLSEIIKLIK